MSINAERARSAFASTAGEINSELDNYRKDVDNINAFNKNLKNTFKTAEDAKALRDIGSEVGVRALKQFGTKYLKGAYEFKIPKAGVSIGDLDRKAGSYLADKAEPYTRDAQELYNQFRGRLDQLPQEARDLLARGRSGALRSIRRFSGGDPEAEVEMRSLGVESEPYGESSGDRMGQSDPQSYETQTERLDNTNGSGENMEDAIDENVENDGLAGEAENTGDADLSFEDFMNQFNAPRKTTGDIDFDRADEQVNMGMEDVRGQQMRAQATDEARARENMGAEDYDANQATERAGMEAEDVNALAGEDAEVTEGAENMEPNIRKAFGEEVKSDADTVAENAKIKAQTNEDLGGEDDIGAGEELAEGAGEEGAELGGEEGAVTGLESVGGLLDSTGVFAPLGALFNLAGLGVEAFTAYQAGKGAVDWVKSELGGGPKAPQAKLPTLQKTLAQRGQMVIPTTDSIDTITATPGW